MHVLYHCARKLALIRKSGSLWLQRAMIIPLHYSLRNRAKPCLEERKKSNKEKKREKEREKEKGVGRRREGEGWREGRRDGGRKEGRKERRKPATQREIETEGRKEGPGRVWFPNSLFLRLSSFCAFSLSYFLTLLDSRCC